MRMREIVAKRMLAPLHKIAGDEAKMGHRQQSRALARKQAFAHITEKHGPEPRRVRRLMALRLAKRKS